MSVTCSHWPVFISSLYIDTKFCGLFFFLMESAFHSGK